MNIKRYLHVEEESSFLPNLVVMHSIYWFNQILDNSSLLFFTTLDANQTALQQCDLSSLKLLHLLLTPHLEGSHNAN